MWAAFWSHAKWFTNESREYMGRVSWENSSWMPGEARYGFPVLAWRDRLRWPAAFSRFIWYSRHDIMRGIKL